MAANAVWHNQETGEILATMQDGTQFLINFRDKEKTDSLMNPDCTCNIIVPMLISGGYVEATLIGGQDDCPIHGLSEEYNNMIDLP